MDSDEDLDHSIYTFLQGRNVDIDKLKQQKINSKVMEEMDDHELSSFIPMYGDRVIVRSFIRKGTTKGTSKRKSKGGILASLKQTIKSMRKKNKKKGTSDSESDETSTCTQSSNKYIGNKNAIKETRQIKVVPMKKDIVGSFTKIRTKKGGGPRKLSINKAARKDDILHLAKKVYFGNTGTSKLGNADECKFEVQNYEGDDMDEKLTEGDMYRETGLTLLTFYFIIIPPDDEDLPKLLSPRKNVKNDQLEDEKEFKEKENDNMSSGAQVCENVNYKGVLADLGGNTEKGHGDESITQSVGTDILAEAMFASGVCNLDGSLENLPDIDFLDHEAYRETDGISGNAQLCEDGSFSVPYEHVEHVESSCKIRVRRSDLLNDLITIFKKPDILDQNIRFEYINEIGADVDGVSRDVYSTFWVELFMCSSEGEECRVPALSPKWQADEWTSIGRILAKGYKDHKVFPLQLAQVATVALSFGEEAVTSGLLFDTFMRFVSQSDRETVQAALKEDLSGDEKDDLLDFLDRYGCSTNPKKENLRLIIDKIAHKELVQKPKYAIDNMAVACREVFMSLFVSVDKLLQVYADLVPTPKKVIKLLKATPLSNGEMNSLRYFQQYIRGQDNASLRKLLRFMIGSETLTVNEIEISFTELEGFRRRPISHTCGPSLELPSTYSSYPELRMEFDHILSNENCFELNIV